MGIKGMVALGVVGGHLEQCADVSPADRVSVIAEGKRDQIRV